MIKCKNKYCKHHNEGCSLEEVTINSEGNCESYEKGLSYYLTLLPRTMTSNFICYPDLTYELRCSIYYLMKCIPLSFASDDLRGIIYFKNENTGEKFINSRDIWDMIESDIDVDKVCECIHELETKGLPTKDDEDEEDSDPPKKEYQEYGWLSPTGEYTEVEFGDHEKAAHDIIKSSNFGEEYSDWFLQKKCKYSVCNDYRDFLSQVKGYALIHDPSGLGRYIVTHTKPLTKKQKEFLYGYFMDIGKTIRAEEYLDE